jgi:squalene-hopene/tetraprenyl-beta-curcumene cyclase
MPFDSPKHFHFRNDPRMPLGSRAALVLAAGLILAIVSPSSSASAAAERAAAAARPDENASFRQEIGHAIQRGVTWLQANQNSNGWWSTPDQPAVTALALTAALGEPAGTFTNNWPAWVRQGFAYVLANARPDGGIHRSNLVTYNTAISLVALTVANRPEYDPVARRAREFLIGLQRDFGEKGKIDDVFDGGIGYGSRYEHSDMGNTLAALEAIYYSRRLAGERPGGGGGNGARDLNWAAAVQFLQNCQNLPSHNQQAWASDDPKQRGGFIYYPGHSMAGAETNASTGRVALRSYGSISYGGLLSYIYADLRHDDPRVTAVFDWLRRNFTLEENPGLGPQGFYFYLHTMTKALNAYGVRELALADGRTIPWRRDVAARLINLQQKDGSWMNDNGRWWERDPALVTAYAVLSLEIIHRGL